MTTALILVSDGSTLPAALGPDLAAAVDLAKAEKAASTRKPSWRASPCRPMRRASMPPCAAFAEPMAAQGSAKLRR
jgi:hypothetical protein